MTIFAPELLANLVAEGFFDRFDKVLFVGASMGGFGALNYASVVPGATVLAFSWFVFYLAHVQLLLMLGPLIVK